KNKTDTQKYSDLYFGNNLSTNPTDWEAFLKILNSNGINLSFIDKTILWSLLQMNIRPDLSSPTSNLQLLINENGNGMYWEFSVNETSNVLASLFSKNDSSFNLENLIEEKSEISLMIDDIEKRTTKKYTDRSTDDIQNTSDIIKKPSAKKEKKEKKESLFFYPYVFGLETIANHYKSKYSLLELAELLDKYYNFSIIVNDDFEKFLNLSTELRSNVDFKKNYFHEDEILKQYEQIPKIDFSKVINNYLKNNYKISAKSIYKISNFLFNINNLNEQPLSKTSEQLVSNVNNNNNDKNSQNDIKDIKILCNKDINTYTKFLLNIKDQQIKGNIFGNFSVNQNKSALAFSNQIINYPFSLFNSPLIGTLNIHPTASNTFATFCFIQNLSTTNRYTLSLISSNDRDPSQHIYHLLKFDLKNLNSLEGIKQLLQNARYIILKNPLRLILESKRTNKDQLEKIMSMDVPIYHSPALGDIWGVAHLANNPSGIIIDDRNIEHGFCFQTNNKDK
ncbi:MAG: hypothetical protein HQK51_11895, partial [Oligoflexia bacterium]|nr:hypothetical protein [Oligoflexia bacterium]